MYVSTRVTPPTCILTRYEHRPVWVLAGRGQQSFTSGLQHVSRSTDETLRVFVLCVSVGVHIHVCMCMYLSEHKTISLSF